MKEAATETSRRPSKPRSGACCSELPKDYGQDLLMFGGYTEDESMNREATNETWLFSLAEDLWSKVTCKSSDIPR
ncbi:hypothetical protein WJX84_010995, partial [Apatococcus fuscideae]